MEHGVSVSWGWSEYGKENVDFESEIGSEF